MVLSLATISSFYGSFSDLIIVQTGTGTVNDYFDAFSAYAESVGFTDPEILIPCFINGLNIQIYRKIFGKDYRSLLDVWLKARICEMNLEEDQQLDPDIHTQIQQIQITIPESEAQIQSEQEAEKRKSESEIGEGNAVIIQNTDPEFTTIAKLELHSTQQIRSQFQIQSQSQEDGDVFDENGIYYGSNDRSVIVVVQRPPPEPPDLNSVAVVEYEPESAVVTAKTGSCKTEYLRDAMAGIHSGAEDGAVVKGKVYTDIGTSSTPEKGKLLTVPCWTIGDELRKGMAMTPVVSQTNSIETETVKDTNTLPRGGNWRCSKVLPWEREGGFGTVQKQEEMVLSGAGMAGGKGGGRAPWKGDDRVNVVELASVSSLLWHHGHSGCWFWTATSNLGQKGRVISLLFRFISKNEKCELTPILEMGLLSFPNQAQSEIIKGDKQTYWVMIFGLNYRQWDPSGKEGVKQLKEGKFQNIDEGGAGVQDGKGTLEIAINASVITISKYHQSKIQFLQDQAGFR
ncbi:hypothetical protein PIB30_037193 [Stylosanthes scabra]|uniref:Uncharacterized protein n=1 Tax=Stylosanthes scabra TaxID=79078 RepID=A0ABU6WC49_9FABA|nr:hypothetical protein [Stylosanthes scabra]